MPMRHPCKGMSPAQIRAFERIAVSQHPRATNATLKVLLAEGLIVRGTEKRQDRGVVYEVPSFYVPLPIHAQGCAWCEENVEVEL